MYVIITQKLILLQTLKENNYARKRSYRQVLQKKYSS